MAMPPTRGQPPRTWSPPGRSRLNVRMSLVAAFGVVALGGCGTSSSNGSTTTSSAGDSSSSSGCPEATQADASAALGKPAQQGVAEGDGRCFFASGDTKTAPATEYVHVTV